METFKKYLPWILFGFFIITSIAFMPSFCSIVAIIITLIIAPFNKWQNIVRRFLKGKIKTIAIVALTILMICVYPKPDTITSKVDTYQNTTTIITDTTISATQPTSQVITKATDSISVEDATTIKATTTILSTEPTEEIEETTPHTHTYSAATCTTPKACACGATEGNALGHNWEDATCSNPKTCTVCYITSGTVANHNYSNGNCTMCGKEDPDYVEEAMVWVTKTGKKYHSISKCGNTKSSNQVPLSTAKRRGLTACDKCY